MEGIKNRRIWKPLIRLIALACAVILISTVLLPSAADAGEAKTVRVGYYENEVFQEGAAEGAVKTGYAYEYYRKLSEYTGWKYEYVYGGFSELYQMLLDGEVDLLAGLAWREERAGLMGYPEAIMGNESYYLVKHSGNYAVTADPATMNGCRIGVLESAMVSVLQRYLDDHNVDAEVVTYPEYTALFAAFDSNEFDILAVSRESDGISVEAIHGVFYFLGPFLFRHHVVGIGVIIVESEQVIVQRIRLLLLYQPERHQPMSVVTFPIAADGAPVALRHQRA